MKTALHKLVVGVLLIMIFFAIGGASAHAAFGGPFGGRILMKIKCSCSGGDLIVVGPPTTGVYIVTPPTKVYDYDNIRFGEWVLGMTLPGVLPCLTGFACFPAGFGTPIWYTGTS